MVPMDLAQKHVEVVFNTNTVHVPIHDQPMVVKDVQVLLLIQGHATLMHAQVSVQKKVLF